MYFGYDVCNRGQIVSSPNYLGILLKRIKWFQISVVVSFVFFCSVMLFVVLVVVQKRSSGYMNIDAAKIQQMRQI